MLRNAQKRDVREQLIRESEAALDHERAEMLRREDSTKSIDASLLPEPKGVDLGAAYMQNLDLYKEKLLELVSAGDAYQVRSLLENAPALPKYRDAQQFRFRMQQSGVRVTREDVHISILALAVNVGSAAIVRLLIRELDNIDPERGLEAMALNAPMLNNKSGRRMVRRISPLQFACSLGLFTIVEELLSAGANPNGLDGRSFDEPTDDALERELNDFIYDDWEPPLLIALSPGMREQAL